jgi:hypothetical protein
MKRSIIILSISQDSFDYDLLLNYLRINCLVTKLYIIPQGFLIETEMCLIERKKFIGTIIQSDVTDIRIHDILFEENCIKT